MPYQLHVWLLLAQDRPGRQMNFMKAHLKGDKISYFVVEVAGDHSEIWRWGEQKPDKLH